MSGSEDARPAAMDPSIRENYCFEGYDSERDVGYFVHLSRWGCDPSIWREQVQLSLPDGDYLLHRAWGQGDTPDGPGGALLKLTRGASQKHWGIRYRGPARRTTQQELLKAPLEERAPILVDLDVNFRSDYPIWQLGKQSEGGDWRYWHIEQPGQSRGIVAMDGNTFKISGPGYHNHGRGTRQLTAMFDHCWLHGIFSGGRAFAVYHVRLKPDSSPPIAALEEAVIWHEGRLYPALCKAPPLLGDAVSPLTDPPGDFLLEITSELGNMHVEAHTKRCIPHSTTSTGDWLDGVVLSRKTLAHLVAYERPTVFHWNGEVGVGHTEQTRRLSG